MEVEEGLLLLKERLVKEAKNYGISPSVPQENYFEFSFPHLDVDLDLNRQVCDMRIYANKDAVPLSVYAYKGRNNGKKLQSHVTLQHKILDAYFDDRLIAYIKPYSHLRGLLKGEETRVLFFNPNEDPQYVDVETLKPFSSEGPQYISILSPNSKK